MIDAQIIIELLDLQPLPEEGGYYKETYRSDESIAKDHLPARYKSDKSYGTAVYYLLTEDNPSLMHRVNSDETLHFYLGDTVEMIMLLPDTTGKIITIGNKILNNCQLQVTVPRHCWQGIMLKPGGSFALMGTTVYPGFDFEDFELGSRDVLLIQYPKFREQIIKLTR